MLDPKEHHRVLDPACGSGGFLVMVLDHVRQQITKELYPDLEGPYLEEKYNSRSARLLNAPKRSLGFFFPSRNFLVLPNDLPGSRDSITICGVL